MTQDTNANPTWGITSWVVEKIKSTSPKIPLMPNRWTLPEGHQMVLSCKQVVKVEGGKYVV
jgi:hypothetical protein